VTDRDRRIVEFLLSHGFTTADELQSRLERCFLAMLSKYNPTKRPPAALRRQAAEEAAALMAGFGTGGKVPMVPHRWHLHRENIFPEKLSDAAFLLTSKN
jgi:hypothetical protein